MIVDGEGYLSGLTSGLVNISGCCQAFNLVIELAMRPFKFRLYCNISIKNLLSMCSC